MHKRISACTVKLHEAGGIRRNGKAGKVPAIRSRGDSKMETIVSIFHERANAERARLQLHSLGINGDKITTLTPDTTDRQIQASVRTSDSESPGMGGALGGTVGGAVGAATGASLAAAATSLFVPGVGPILAAGVLGAAVLGAGGALAGVVAGEALEHNLATGLPHDELFVYENALRKGHTVLIVNADDGDIAERVRGVLAQTGAESIDAARENWWLGLRNAEQEKYEGDFERVEFNYRLGFEAALRPWLRGKSLDEATPDLNQLEKNLSSDKVFRCGFERGRAHQRSLEEKYKA